MGGLSRSPNKSNQSIWGGFSNKIFRSINISDRWVGRLRESGNSDKIPIILLTLTRHWNDFSNAGKNVKIGRTVRKLCPIEA